MLSISSPPPHSMHHHPPSILQSSRLALLLALTAIPVLTGISHGVTYIAPQPYLSFNGAPAGSAISPFSLVPFYYLVNCLIP